MRVVIKWDVRLFYRILLESKKNREIENVVLNVFFPLLIWDNIQKSCFFLNIAFRVIIMLLILCVSIYHSLTKRGRNLDKNRNKYYI